MVGNLLNGILSFYCFYAVLIFFLKLLIPSISLQSTFITDVCSIQLIQGLAQGRRLNDKHEVDRNEKPWTTSPIFQQFLQYVFLVDRNSTLKGSCCINCLFQRFQLLQFSQLLVWL